MQMFRQPEALRVYPEVTSFAVRLPDRNVTCIVEEPPIICSADPLSRAGAPYVGLEGPVAICPERPLFIFLAPMTWQTSWRPFMRMVIHALVELISPPVMICRIMTDYMSQQ